MSYRELPEGWATDVVEQLFHVNPRKPAADLHKPDTPVSFVPMEAVDAKLGQIVDAVHRPFGAVRKGYTAFAEGDVLLAKITPCFENGKAAIATGLCNGLGFGSSEFHVFRPTGAVQAEYLFHFLRQQQFRDDGAHHMAGAVGQARVPAEYVKEIELPVPPLAEQHRIVEKVEALLEQANRAKARLDRVPLILKRFRQAVLAAAFSGELTSDLRKGQPPSSRLPELLSSRRRLWEKRQLLRKARLGSYPGPADINVPDDMDIPRSWEWVTVSHLAFLDVGFSFKSAEFSETGIRLLRGENIAPGTLRWSDTRFWPRKKTHGFEHLLVEPGEIILGMDRPLVSAGLKIARVTETDVPALLVQRVMRFKMVDRSDADYLYYCFAARRFADFLVHGGMTGSDLPHITGTGVSEYAVPLPPADEQAEIVSRICCLMTLAEAIEKRVNLAASRIGGMMQSILSKAFSGDLVPTEAELARAERRSYETAAELLARIRTPLDDAPSAPRSARSRRSRRRQVPA